jgi:hypothetical protein
MSRPAFLSRFQTRVLSLSLVLFATMPLQGCATTVENIALGAGLGAVGTVSALGCLLTCQQPEHGW